MKKNKFLRAASALLIATLVSTCAISGTYAKYVTEGSVSDTARVANFGVVINASGTLYSTAYYNAQNTASGNLPATGVAVGTTASTASVKSSNTDNVVAPGTQSYGNGLSFGVSGTPEVEVNVSGSISAEDIYLGTGTWVVMTQVDSTVTAQNFSSYGDLYVVNGQTGAYSVAQSYDSTATYYQITDSETVVTADYYPVVYTLGGNTTYTGSVSAASAQAVASTLVTAIGNSGTTTTTDKYKTEYTSISVDYPALTDLGAATSGKGLGDLTLSWVWDFDASGAGTYDAQDTILGDLIAQENGATDYFVAYNSATSGATSYTPVTISSHVVTATVNSTSTIVAYLQTSFDIDLTVTQID